MGGDWTNTAESRNTDKWCLCLYSLGAYILDFNRDYRYHGQTINVYIGLQVSHLRKSCELKGYCLPEKQIIIG